MALRSASTDWQAAFGPKSPRPRWPYLMAGRLSVEVGPTWPQSPYNVEGNWRIVQLCGRRQMYGTSALVYPTCLPVAPLGRQTGTTASDLVVLTGDLVLADNRRFPLFLHARAVALSMPEPSLGAPVPSRSLLFGVELFDRFARPWASVSRFARIVPPPAGFVVARRHRLAFCLISPCHPRRPRRVSILERQ